MFEIVEIDVPELRRHWALFEQGLWQIIKKGDLDIIPADIYVRCVKKEVHPFVVIKESEVVGMCILRTLVDVTTGEKTLFIDHAYTLPAHNGLMEQLHHKIIELGKKMEMDNVQFESMRKGWFKLLNKIYASGKSGWYPKHILFQRDL